MCIGRSSFPLSRNCKGGGGMKPKLKAALWVLYLFLGFFAMFGLFILMAITKWGYMVVAGVFTVAMIYGSYKAFYLIFKDDEL